MVVKAIPAHVWPLILPHLRKPIPPPLSAPPRNALRQSALCNAAVVCKLWHEIVVPLLYTHIATDQIGFCLANIHHPSDRILFTRTRSLYIEYSDLERESSYEEILRIGEGVWADFGVVSEKEALQRRARNCKTESLLLADCLETVNNAGPAFPKLETLAVSSIYDTCNTWHVYDLDNGRNPPDVTACLKQFHDLLLSLKPIHLCLRATSGPLSLPKVFWTSIAPLGGHSLTNHIPRLPWDMYPLLPLGKGVRWVFDTESAEDWAPTIHRLESCLRQFSRFRKVTEFKGAGKDVADIEIFSSSAEFSLPLPFEPTIDSFISHPPPPGTIPHILSQATQEAMVQQLGDLTQAFLRRDSGLQDRVTWRTSAETPRCKACGAGPPA